MSFRAVDRPEVDSVLSGIASDMTGGEEKKMFAIGQEPGPAFRRMLRLVEHRCRGGCATLRAYFHQRALKIGREDDHIIGAPSSSARVSRIGNVGNGTTCGRHLHQLAAGEESDVAAVGRPERMRSAGCTLKRLRR